MFLYNLSPDHHGSDLCAFGDGVISGQSIELYDGSYHVPQAESSLNPVKQHVLFNKLFIKTTGQKKTFQYVILIDTYYNLYI